MNPLLRLLTGQIVFSAAFVGACELPNWIHALRQVNACLERWMTVSAPVLPLRHAVRCREQPAHSGRPRQESLSGLGG